MPRTKETDTKMAITKIVLPEDRVEPLTPEELEIVKPNRGRRATPSRYLAQVQEAATTPNVPYKVEIYPGYDLTPTQILSELRKAGKQAGVKLWTADKSKEAHPFIAFKVKETPAPEAEQDGEGE